MQGQQQPVHKISQFLTIVIFFVAFVSHVLPSGSNAVPFTVFVSVLFSSGLQLTLALKHSVTVVPGNILNTIHSKLSLS